MSALSRIRNAGFSVTPADDYFDISPASRLTPDQREFLKSHKAEIIEELKTEQAFVTSNTSAGKPIAILAQDKAAILRWLHYIGENNQTIIDDVLHYCEATREALAYPEAGRGSIRTSGSMPPLSSF